MQSLPRALANIYKSREHFFKKLDGQYPEELFNVQSEELREEYEKHFEEPSMFEKLPVPIEFQLKLFILFPAEPVTKPTPQHFMELVTPQLSEPTPLQSLPPISEPFIPKMALVVKEHHTRHRVIERIGFRSPLASCSAFVRLCLYPAITLPFSSWTFNMVPCVNQWEFSDHG